jgi:riboflavin kinase/FMN adenylyltransferase
VIVQRWRSLDDVPDDWERSVVTIGVFDGVHRGHAEIIAHAVATAKEMDRPSVVLTFSPHPSEVVRPGSHPPELTTQMRRSELVAELGVDVFCALPFTTEFSLLEPQEFVWRAVVSRLHTEAVLVGENFRFGHGASGDVSTLITLGERYGFTVNGIPLLRDGDTAISSTFIRTCLEAGDPRGAAHALGRPHRVDGVVERGDQRGRELGFPTANLRTDKYAAIPADGVYAGSVWRLDERGQTVARLGTAAISVGTNPTFEGHERRVEAYVLDFDGDLYGDGLGVEFVQLLRRMERYDSIDDLITQMHRDVAATRVVMTES